MDDSVERARPRYPGSDHDAEWRRLVFPADYRPPEPKTRYHLVVVGAGPAGLVTAIAAAGLGAKVALVEKRAMGGDCLNVGCVPSKALLEYTRGGIDAAEADEAFAALRRVRASIARHDSVERYTEAGVDVFLGPARFVDAETVRVGEHSLVARRAVIATGSHPVLPDIAGLAESRPHTNETVFDLRRVPRRLAILGAGPVGCELGQAFANMDVDVVLIESDERVLPRESADASRAVGRALERAGVGVKLGAKVTGVARRGPAVAIELAAPPRAAPEELVVDELLVAAGRRASTDELNLAAVGVDVDAAGRIVVDRYLRTTNPRIYAAGDVCSPTQLTHLADAHARIVVQNALFVPSATTDKLAVPRCTYTSPEVAQIGPLREELERSGAAFDAYRVEFAELDRGKTQGDDDGFAEILTARGRDEILGATLVGRDAGEHVAIVAIAMTLGLGLGDLGKAVLPYPTRAEFVKKLADAYRRTRLTPRRARLVEMWLKWRG